MRYEDCSKTFLPNLVLTGLVWLASMSQLRASQTPTFTTEPFQYLASELLQKKVVALADFAHENAYPFQMVIRTLNHWLEDPNQSGQSLTLGIEADTALVNVVQTYMTSGNWQPLFEYLLPFTSLENLEFYHDLRIFWLDVKKFNSTRNLIQHKKFRLAGFESTSLLSQFNTHNSISDTAIQAALKDRDKMIAQKVLSYIDDHISEHLLLFYGTNHLRKHPTKVSYINRFFSGAENHYPMGHFLTANLDTQFLSVAQSPYPRILREPDHADRNLTGRDLLFKSQDIPWKMTRINPEDFDAVIFLQSEEIDEPHYLRFICSRRVCEQALNKMSLLESRRSYPLVQQYYQKIQESLQFLTGEYFEDSNACRQWLRAHPYDGLHYLESKAFAEQIYRFYLAQASKARTVKLMSIGLPSVYATTSHRFNRSEWFDRVWPKLKPRVLYLNYIGLYWLGYPREQKQAKDFLMEFTHKDFDSPALYLKWYRQQFLRLVY